MAEIKSVSIVSVVTICLAIAAGAWGLSNTIALSRVKDVENNITIGVTDRGQIWRAIERLTESANNREKKLDEIQADVKPCYGNRIRIKLLDNVIHLLYFTPMDTRKLERVVVLCTPDDVARIKRYCKAKKVNRSEFVRETIMAKVDAHEKRTEKVAAPA